MIKQESFTGTTPLEAMQRALNLTRTEREMISILGKNKAMQYTSLENINKQIDEELLSKVLRDK